MSIKARLCSLEKFRLWDGKTGLADRIRRARQKTPIARTHEEIRQISSDIRARLKINKLF